MQLMPPTGQVEILALPAQDSRWTQTHEPANQPIGHAQTFAKVDVAGLQLRNPCDALLQESVHGLVAEDPGVDKENADALG